MATATPAQHNPFRTSNATPNTTGVSTSSSGQTSIHVIEPPRQDSDAAGLNEELPPAYTPGPDMYQGETTLEYGPSRPFQPAPQLPNASPFASSLHHQPTSGTWSQNSTRPQRPAGSSNGLPSILNQITARLTSEMEAFAAAVNSSQQRYGANTQRPSSAGNPSGSGWGGYPGQQFHPQTPQHTSYLSAQNTGVPQQQNFASPPNLPPRPPTHPSLGAAASTPTSPTSQQGHATSPSSDFARDFYQAGTGPPSQTAAEAPPQDSEQRRQTPEDDGRPTTTPVPGRPLLNAGRLLVYPKGFECEKCRNTGYKQNDPSHPCRKCWAKHSKPFTGALTYTSFTAPLSSTDSVSLQRPLPNLRPPQQAGPSQSGYPGQQHRFQNQAQPPQPPQNGRYIRPVSSFEHPPPRQLVYAPGDPRIGGRLCYKCHGSGLVTFLIFEETTCGTCGGIGRVFR